MLQVTPAHLAIVWILAQILPIPGTKHRKVHGRKSKSRRIELIQTEQEQLEEIFL